MKRMKEPRQKCLWILDGKLILRCQLQKNILKVFVFLTETKEPIELYAKKVSEVIGYAPFWQRSRVKMERPTDLL